MAPVAGTHCMCIVNLGENNLYMVEVGAGYPFLEPIPMQNLPFKFVAGGFINEFREMSQGVVGRFQIGGGLYGGAYIGKDESLRTSWYLIPKTYEDFAYAMDQTFTTVAVSGLLKSNYFCRYFFPGEYYQLYPEHHSANSCSEPNQPNKKSSDEPTDYVFIFKRRIIIGNAFERTNVRQFEYEEMVVEIKKCFPKLEINDISKAMEIFSKIEIVPSPYDTIL